MATISASYGPPTKSNHEQLQDIWDMATGTSTPRTPSTAAYAAAKKAMATMGHTGLEQLFEEEEAQAANTVSSVELNPFEMAAHNLGISVDELEKIFENSVKWNEYQEGGRIYVNPIPKVYTPEEYTLTYTSKEEDDAACRRKEATERAAKSTTTPSTFGSMWKTLLGK